jgi:hypothetical protein
MSASAKYTDRVMELLVQRATDGLNASEQVELNRLLGQSKHSDGNQFEPTAAALLLAGVGEEEPLPEGLKAKLMVQAENFSIQMPRSAVVNMPVAEATAPATRRRPVPARSAKSTGRASTQQPWAWLAVAASFLFAIAGWWPRLGDEGEVDLERQREQLLALQATVQKEWQATQDPAAKGVSGDVVWNQVTQVGYMRFRGLPSNNPQRAQYQLWIFDRARGDKYPVDGGVFDVPNDKGEIVIPITARLPVRDPAMFAVTLEEAGGTVVSDREHILVLAKVAT